MPRVGCARQWQGGCIRGSDGVVITAALVQRSFRVQRAPVGMGSLPGRRRPYAAFVTQEARTARYLCT